MQSPFMLKPFKRAYYKKIIRMFGSSLIAYWPMNEKIGTVAREVIHGLNGTYNGPTLNSLAFPGGGGIPSFDGSNDYLSAYSAGLQSVFSGEEGAMVVWLKIPATTYADGLESYPIQFSNAANSLLWRIKKSTTAHQLVFYALNASFTLACIRENLMQLWVSWSKIADRIDVYLNGELYYGSAGFSLGAYATPITKAIIGAWNSSSYWFPGNSGHVGLLNRPVVASEVKRSYDVTYPWFRISIIGDSIPYNLSSWAYLLADQYKSGNTHLMNHAVSGNTIIANMDTQVVAAAGDAANIIIMELGVNDNDAGDMAALQAEVEENIIEIKGTNPEATIYYMNVLPCWTDVGGGTVYTKTHIRPAIAAACLAQGITCWDTFTTPWIAVTDTSDGLHPTAAGHVKIIAEILALLP